MPVFVSNTDAQYILAIQGGPKMAPFYAP